MSDGTSMLGILNLELQFARWYLPRGIVVSKESGASEQKPSTSWNMSKIDGV